MSEYKISPSLYQVMFYDLYPILCSINRQHELRRLIAWAEQKKLEKPLRLYRNRLRDEEARLLRYRIDRPRLVRLEYIVHKIVYGVFPPPRYTRKGAANGYSIKKR